MTDRAVIRHTPQRAVIRQPRQLVAIRATPQRVTMRQSVQTVSVRATPQKVVVRAGGPRGAPGGAYFEHTQGSPATVWTINHNLGFRPSVELRTAGGQEFDADVQHPSTNQVVVNLNAPLAGFARLN